MIRIQDILLSYNLEKNKAVLELNQEIRELDSQEIERLKHWFDEAYTYCLIKNATNPNNLNETQRLLRITITKENFPDFSTRTMKGLESLYHVKNIYDLVKKTEGELLRTRNFGRKSLNEIKQFLTDNGLGFGMREEDVESLWHRGRLSNF